jgi:hypothetical protein
MGDREVDARPVPEGQQHPLPLRAVFPGQLLSWTSILVQQKTATNEAKRWTRRWMESFIPPEGYPYLHSYMLLSRRLALATFA